MLEANGRNHLLTLAYFQRIPGCALYGVGNGNGDGGGMPQPAEDLIRAWRRSRDEPLPPELRGVLEACDSNTLFNVLGATIDLLLRRITPVRENKRARRALKFRRRNLRRALERTEQRIVAHDALNDAGACATAVSAVQLSGVVRGDPPPADSQSSGTQPSPDGARAVAG